MTRSTRFPAAIHILTLLTLKEGQSCSSEWMAKSLGTNAVVVRRIVGRLQEAGIVSSQPGSQGGTRLEKAPDKLTLREIYEAVEEDSLFSMHTPHPKCRVACSVKDQVSELIDQAEEKMKKDLSKTKLSAITKPALAAYRQSSQSS